MIKIISIIALSVGMYCVLDAACTNSEHKKQQAKTTMYRCKTKYKNSNDFAANKSNRSSIVCKKCGCSKWMHDDE